MSQQDHVDISSLTSQAIAAYKTGDFSKTQWHAQAVLDADAPPREKAVCHQLLGLILYRTMRYEAAVAQLMQAIAIQPEIAELRKDLASAHLAWARQLRKQSLLEEALEQARHAARWQPEDAEAASVVGVVLQELGELDQARAWFEQVLQAAPRNPQVRLNYANLLTSLHELDAAIEEYRVALELRPDHVKTMLNAGAALLQAERIEPALQLLRRAVELDGENADARFNLANGLAASGQVAAAVEHYGHA